MFKVKLVYVLYKIERLFPRRSNTYKLKEGINQIISRKRISNLNLHLNNSENLSHIDEGFQDEGEYLF